MSLIKTDHIRPPIPSRNFDWTAWYDGDDEHGPIGFGATEAEAIADLHAWTDDEREDFQALQRIEHASIYAT